MKNRKNEQLLIGNGRLITRDKENPYIEKGAVLIVGCHIKEVGQDLVLKEKYKEVEYMDATGKVIMPGYINTHNHIYSAFARGLNIPGNHPSDFIEILEGTWWKIDRHLDLYQTYYSAISTYLECIRNGVTTVVDHHASYKEIKKSLFQIADAARRLGIRTCLAYEISDRDGENKMKEAVNETYDFIEYTKKLNDSMLKSMVGMHASFTLSDETIDFCKERNKYGTGYHIHVAEGEYDNLNCLDKYGCSVVDRLNKKGLLGNKTIAGHCIHVSEEDMDILKETNTVVIHNPESNMGNAVGCPNVLKMLDKGIQVGLGTDGFTNDMLESVKVANILQKHNSRNPDRGFLEASQMLFDNNASIASEIFDEQIGVLKEGAAADIILVDYQAFTPINATNLDGHIIFGMSGALTDTTIVNGKVLMKNRKILIDNKENLLEKCREASAELWRDLYE
jgi:putative selenium metabolism protein SsnA